MRKLAFFISTLILPVILTGCFAGNKSGDYLNFVRRNQGQAVNLDQGENNISLRIDYVYPSEVTTEGKQQITIYGAGFVRETKVFIQSPEMIRIEAFVFNPGYLQTWMPSWPAGHYILGVINPDGSQAKWSGVLNYTEKKD